MGRFGRSMQLAKDSWAVLKADKELVVIPVAGFVAMVAVGALVGAGLYFTFNTAGGYTRSTVSGSYVATTSYQPTAATWVLGVIGLYLLTFVSLFFSAALVAGAYQRLTGGDATLGSAFSAAIARFPQIAGWTVVTTLVSLLLSQIRNRGVVGALLGGVLDTAWKVATWLAVPVIIVEGPGPVTSLKRAASLFKQTWGENLIAQAGFGLIGFLAFLAGAAVSVAVGVVLPIAGVVVGIVCLAVMATVLSALNGIFRTALYLYATGHTTPWFSQEVMAAAFAPKVRSGLL